MHITPPTAAEHCADFLSELFQSEVGKALVGFAGFALVGGFLTHEAVFFLATGLFLVFAGVAGPLKSRREQQDSKIEQALVFLPQPHPRWKETSVIKLKIWAKQNPQLVRTTVTRKEARELEREHGLPEGHLDGFVSA